MIKALHPADHTLKAERVPASSRYPTVAQEVISTFDVTKPEWGSVHELPDIWSLKIVTRTDPLVPTEVWACPGVATATAPDGWFFVGSVINQSFWKSTPAFGVHTADELHAARSQFARSCETYRVTALSTTGVFVGATMTDQGSIVSAQCIDEPRTMAYFPSSYIPSTGYTIPANMSTLAEIWYDQLPAMSTASMGTSPYVAPAREGWYAPQKLLVPGHWKKTNQLVYCGRLPVSAMETADVPAFPVSSSDAAISIVPYPYIEGNNGAALWLPPCDDGVSVTYVSGIYKTTTFRITLRLCLEMGCIPTSDLAPFCDLTTPPDALALDLYNEIIKETKDAYPAADNDFGTFFGKVKNIAAKIVRVIEPVANIAAGAGVPFAGTVAAMAKGINAAGEQYLTSKAAREQAATLRAEAAAAAANKAMKQLKAEKAQNTPRFARLKKRAAAAVKRADQQLAEAKAVKAGKL